MGHEFRHKCPVESKKLLLLTGLLFALVLSFQYFELPYNNVLSSLFSGGKSQLPPNSIADNSSLYPITIPFNSLNATTTSVDSKSDFVSDPDGDSDDVLEFDEASNPKNQSLSKNFDLAVENITKKEENSSTILLDNFEPNNNSVADIIKRNGGNEESQNVSKSEERFIDVNSDPTTSFSSAPISKPVESINSLRENEEHSKKKNVPTVISLSEMNKMLLQSQASSHSSKPLWSTAADQELLNAKSLIENVRVMRKTPGLYAALYQNVSMFTRSYELMEQKLKVYIYREGERPIFHTPVLKGIYASEGWFMKLLKANKKYITKNPKEAHLFYLPFSSRMLEETLYVANSHSNKNLREYLKNYLDMLVTKYPFWNRTGGADHFLVACHDWAPSETRQLMANCIRALCNTDLKEGFKFGKDVSLPETRIQSPQNLLRGLGGNPSPRRPVLAFFAGNNHGYLRPILLQHWQNKDPDMKIFGRLPKSKGNKNYINYMKSSKFCICAKGFEVNSPRVVEAIFYECVPVIISDNFVPPFFEVLNWKSFAIFVKERDIPNLKNILLSVSEKKYALMQQRVKQVQQHFLWHGKPVKYDIFNMILHSIWYNRVFQASSL